MLSDYRVIVLGVSGSKRDAGLCGGVSKEIDRCGDGGSSAPTTNDMTRVLGVSSGGEWRDRGKGRSGATRQAAAHDCILQQRSLRSRWYAEALMESEVLRATTRRISDGRAMKVVALRTSTRRRAPCNATRSFAPSPRGGPRRASAGSSATSSCSRKAWTCHRSMRSRSSIPATARSTWCRPWVA